MTLSIITPVYNRHDTITRCVKSVADQIGNRTDIEHIIVNDGSTDNTSDVLNDLQKCYSHIRQDEFSQNRGVNAARNRAIQLARGKYIMFLDSDDQLAPDALQMVLGTIASNPEIKHILFACDVRIGLFSHIGDIKEFSFRDFLEERVSGDFVHVMRSEIVKRYPFDEFLRIHEGINFLRFYREAEKIVYFNRIALIIDRNRTDRVTWTLNMTSTRARDTKIAALERKLQWFEHDYNMTPEGREVLRKQKKTLYQLYILASQYDKASELNISSGITPFTIAHHLRLGRILWIAYANAVRLKHKISN